MDSSICPTCGQPIHLDDSTYVSPNSQTVEHLSCHVRRSADIPAEVEASANPAYGPMS
jgi:hypothetical protein